MIVQPAAPLLCRLASQPNAVLLDVRPAEQFNICHLPGGASTRACCAGASHRQEGLRVRGVNESSHWRAIMGNCQSSCPFQGETLPNAPTPPASSLPILPHSHTHPPTHPHRTSPAGALHAPFKQFDRHMDTVKHRLAAAAQGQATAAPPAAEQHEQGEQRDGDAGGKSEQSPLYVVCRRGNDSQRAVARLRQLGISHAVDVVGGMEAWAREVDPSFPTY